MCLVGARREASMRGWNNTAELGVAELFDATSRFADARF
jgi:hypothetical protein